MISSQESLNLKKLIQQSGDEYVDNTEEIRRLKHSLRLLDDMRQMERLKVEKKELFEDKRTEAKEEFRQLAARCCPFLFEKYTDIFNRLIRDELDIDILGKFLGVLHMIEESKINQEEGSVIIGKLLKEMYIDSAVRHGNHLDEEHDVPVQKVAGKPISWAEWKAQNTQK
jgi:hypothetical protein